MGRFRFQGLDYLEFDGMRLRGKYFLDAGSPCEPVMSIKQIKLLLKAD